MNKRHNHKNKSINKKTKNINKKIVKNFKYKRKKIKKNKKNKKKRKQNNKTLRKNQSGGFPILEIIGGVSALAASAAAAFSSYKYFNLIKEEDKIELLLSNVSNIEYLPRYSIVKSKKYIERYLKCISNSELFDILRDIPELLKTVTIGKLLKNISAMDPSLSKINEILSNDEDKLSVDTIFLTNTDDKLLNELKMYLLATATYSKDPYNDDDYSKLAKNNVNWIDIIFDGGSEFDSTFDAEVDNILEKRGSLTFISPTIRMKLKKLKNNSKLIEAINHKMNDCTKNQRSLYEYITNTISWNENDKCLVCPEEDCLIYIYNYYYGFLNDSSDNIPILTKLYILILCEARAFVLSKCIILEAFRQESGDKSNILEILNKIYERDKKNLYIKPNVPEQYSDFTLFKRPSQKGGQDLNYDSNNEEIKSDENILDDTNIPADENIPIEGENINTDNN